MRALVSLLVFVIAIGSSLAQFADIRLQAQPSATVADGKSTVAISATLRDRDGNLLPDGTQVVFTTTKGAIDQPIVKTYNGTARVTLRAGGVPGMATITATAITYNATASLEFEFVADRSMLSSAKEYIELYAEDRNLVYSLDAKVLEGSSPNGNVFLRYKEIEIRAQDLQVYVPLHEVRARKATLRMGKVERTYDQLFLKLNTRRGFGTTSFSATDYNIKAGATWFSFEKAGDRQRFGVVAVSTDKDEPVYGAVEPRFFEFEEIADSSSIIAAKKVVAYPRKEVQFQRAEVFVGGARIMKLPLFQVNLYGPTPVLTDQILTMRDNQIALNYPYYLTLKPGETSLLRFRAGDRYGRGSGGTRGTSLDYELAWNKGDDWDGFFTFTGIGRKDWGLGVRQYWRIDERTDANISVESPSHSSLFGNLSVGRRFDGFNLSFAGNSNRSLRGSSYSSSQYSVVAEKDPLKFGPLPMRLFFGLTAQHTTNRQFDQAASQSAYGLRARLQSDSINITPNTTFNAELSSSKLSGHNVSAGMAWNGSALVSTRLSKEISLFTGYTYADDGYSSSVLGRHRINVQIPIYTRRGSLDLFMDKSLDIDRLSYRADARINLIRNLRFGYSYTYERFLGQGFTDYYMFLGYTIGFREFGITWSNRTRRIGFEILGVGY
ncbi:MAG TPA: Ig-like domain-containing protein [Fimbriimonadaceae bacterium]|nr:Ig-like domain-containing protein [Fimbriimonadaceae bacterium]